AACVASSATCGGRRSVSRFSSRRNRGSAAASAASPTLSTPIPEMARNRETVIAPSQTRLITARHGAPIIQLRAAPRHRNPRDSAAHSGSGVCARLCSSSAECDDVPCLALKAGLGTPDGAGLGLGRERGTACCSRDPGAGRRAGGPWGSGLTALEFAAIRGVGFEPVGQVFGAAVYATGYTSGYSCPGARGSSGVMAPGRPATQVSGRDDAGSFGPLVEAMDQARRTALGRMTAQCASLGGHGVVGVRLSQGLFPL